MDYYGCFSEYLKSVSWMINGIKWEPKFPRVLACDDLKKAVLAGHSKLMGATDMSAPYEGAVEFSGRHTTIENPFILYDPVTTSYKEKITDFSQN